MMKSQSVEYRCWCGEKATYWKRYGRYVFNGVTKEHKREKGKDGCWHDPISDEYWDKPFPAGMEATWGSYFYCWKHAVYDSEKL